MRALLFSALLGLGSPALAATNYCELTAHAEFLSTKVRVLVDCGVRDPSWVKDQVGDVAKFQSVVGALNHMSRHGWVFEQAYAVSHGNQKVYHYLMSREGDAPHQAEQVQAKLAIEILRPVYMAKNWTAAGTEWDSDIRTVQALLRAGNDWRSVREKAKKMKQPGTLSQ